MMYCEPAERPVPREEKISRSITLCADGKYRWVYSMSLWKHPTVFWLIWKIFFFILLGVAGLMSIADAKWGMERLVSDLKIFGFVLIGMTALIAVGYLLYAAMMGGEYIVEFEMDETGVHHKQIAAQAKKAKKLGRATMIAGAASGRIGTVGAGYNAQRTEMYSQFSKIRKVKVYPRRNLIKVNGRFDHNQVYAAKEDFTFVQTFILSHCTNLKK